MTVEKLIERLEQYPADMQVFLAPRKTEFQFGLLNGVTSKEIAFKEEPEGETLATDTVVILDEE